MMRMIRIFQALDALGEQKVLLLALTDLEIIPNIGEDVEINGNEFMVLRVKHVISTTSPVNDTELLVAPQSLLMDVNYMEQEEYDL
jgi:helix-turn-helix protein